jgi:hypothetical protein
MLQKWSRFTIRNLQSAQSRKNSLNRVAPRRCSASYSECCDARGCNKSTHFSIGSFDLLTKSGACFSEWARPSNSLKQSRRRQHADGRGVKRAGCASVGRSYLSLLRKRQRKTTSAGRKRCVPLRRDTWPPMSQIGWRLGRARNLKTNPRPFPSQGRPWAF